MTTGRINARLPGSVANKVAVLRRRTKKSTSAIVIEAISRYYDEVEDKRGTPAEILMGQGFVGCASGAKDLSRDYKAALTASLQKKT